MTFLGDGELESGVEIVDELMKKKEDASVLVLPLSLVLSSSEPAKEETHLLESRRFDLEVSLDVAPEDSSLEGFDVTSDVGFRSEEMSVVGVPVRLLVSIRHDDLSLVSLHLKKIRNERERKSARVRTREGERNRRVEPFPSPSTSARPTQLFPPSQDSKEQRDVTHHQQRLTQRPRSLPEHLVRVEGNDVAEREDERMDVGHVEVVGRHSVRDRVLSENLRFLDGVAVSDKAKRSV